MIIRKYSAALLAVFFSFATSVVVAQSYTSNPIQIGNNFPGTNIASYVSAPLTGSTDIFAVSLGSNFLSVSAIDQQTGRRFHCTNSAQHANFAHNADIIKQLKEHSYVRVFRASATSNACNKMFYGFSVSY